MRECEYYEELISRLVDSELNKNEYDALWMHIKNCSRCNAMYAVFHAMSDIIADDTTELPEGLHENIMAGVRRNDIIRKNRFTISRPVRNALAAAACAVFVLFAARGLSPASRAKDVAMTGTEAAIVQMDQAETPAEAAPQESSAPAAPAAPAVEAAAPVPAATPASVVPAASAAPAPPVPTRDIYLSDNSAVQSTPSAPPAAAYTQAPTPAPAETPLVALTPVSTPAPAASVPAAQSPVQSGSTEVPAAPEAAAKAPVTNNAGVPETETEDAPEATEAPSLLSRGFKSLFVSAPALSKAAPPPQAAAAPAAEDAAPAAEEAAPVAEAAPAEEAAEISAAPEASKEPGETMTKAVLKEQDQAEALLKLLDGTEKALPTEKADKVFKIVLPAEPAENGHTPATLEPTAVPTPAASPDGSPVPDLDDSKGKMYVFFFGKEVYYLSYDKEEANAFLAKCTTEEFEKFIDALSEVSTIPVESPAPTPTHNAIPASGDDSKIDP